MLHSYDFLGSVDQSSEQLQTWFSEHFFLAESLSPMLFCYDAANMVGKMSKKTYSDGGKRLESVTNS